MQEKTGRVKDSNGQGTGWPVGRGTNAGLRTLSHRWGKDKEELKMALIPLSLSMEKSV